MTEIVNLASKMETQLPAELVEFIQKAGRAAADSGLKLYLIGGVVRDLLLGKTNFDLDLVVEGNALDLARNLIDSNRGKIVIHTRFQTAKLRWNRWTIDLATARAETYARPGALPTVKPSSIENDLFRRDFTINAMAIHLNPGRYGELLDIYGGKEDIDRRLVRILHERSFIDDATRIWRALRYEQRLDFQVEADTLRLLRRDVPMLDTISSDRIRHELELVLKEELPEKVLSRAEELGVLSRLHPALKGNGWLAEKFRQARRQSHPNLPPVALYLALMAYRLSEEQNEEFTSRLRLPKSVVQTLRDTLNLRSELQILANPGITPSHIYYLLHNYSLPAIMANRLATDIPIISRNIDLHLSKLANIRPTLTGEDLKKMGISPGPDIGLILRQIHEARLDGKICTKQDERALVQEWLEARRSENTGPPRLKGDV